MTTTEYFKLPGTQTPTLVTWNSLTFRRVQTCHFPPYPFSASCQSASMLKHLPFWGVRETRQTSRIFSKIRVKWSKRNVSTDTNQEKGKADRSCWSSSSCYLHALCSEPFFLRWSIHLLLLPPGPDQSCCVQKQCWRTYEGLDNMVVALIWFVFFQHDCISLGFGFLLSLLVKSISVEEAIVPGTSHLTSRLSTKPGAHTPHMHTAGLSPCCKKPLR